jgi:hypothetical protein
MVKNIGVDCQDLLETLAYFIDQNNREQERNLLQCQFFYQTFA